MKWLLLSTLVLLPACSSTPTQQKETSKKLGALTVTYDDARIGTYISSWPGFRTSSYWIEGPDGLVLIDSQFLLSAAEAMIDSAEKLTGKKAVLAIILHPNPDKFNGTSVFQKRGIKVVTSQQVLGHIPAVHELRTGWFYERFKPDYPAEQPKPEAFGDKTQEIQAAGLTLKAHVIGAGCSESHVVVEYDKHLFVGDLVTQGFHSWLELGMIEEWLKRLDEIDAMKGKFVHTGRGGSGDTDLIARERQYLKTVLAVFKKHRPSKKKTLTEATSRQILNEILTKYPSYDYPLFIENGIEATWQKLSK